MLAPPLTAALVMLVIAALGGYAYYRLTRPPKTGGEKEPSEDVYTPTGWEL